MFNRKTKECKEKGCYSDDLDVIIIPQTGLKINCFRCGSVIHHVNNHNYIKGMRAIYTKGRLVTSYL